MRDPRRILLIVALLLLSAGVVWQQRRQAAALPSPAGSKPATRDHAEGAGLKGPTKGTEGQTTNSPAVTDTLAGAVPASSGLTGSPRPSPPWEAADPDTSKPKTSMPLEPLISPSGKQSLIARDGTPLRVELSPGLAASAVELQAWTQEESRNAAGQYDWRFKIKVPAGGLVERTDTTLFTAPETGYQTDIEYSMAQTLPASQWANSLGKSFFVHFDNDTYGLLNVQMVAGGAHFVTVKAWLNPAAGSRNLQLPPPLPVKAR